MIKVLHISSHMGGGVGRFLSQTTGYEKLNNSQYEHKIMLLEKPEKSQFIDICIENGVEVRIAERYDQVKDAIAQADITILHWWHHPKMCELMASFPAIKCRLILWSHVSGCNYPALSYELAMLPQRVFFTSEYSYENPQWDAKKLEIVKKKSEVVYGLGVNAEAMRDTPKEHIQKSENQKEQFKIIYVGTLDKSKIHPDFISYCKEVVNQIPCARFVMVGDLDGSDKLMKEARLASIEEHFDFIGYTKNVDLHLSESDVFGYPLNPFHFGTTENAVLEAMAAGVPVVMLNQCTEKYIVENGHDGFLAVDELEYAKYMLSLYENPKERIRIAENARKTILEKYSLKRNILKMQKQFELLLEEKPKIYGFKEVIGEKPIHWFLSGLGSEKKRFQDLLENKQNQGDLVKTEDWPLILKGKSKGSIEHFYTSFPKDTDLKFLAEINDRKI